MSEADVTRAIAAVHSQHSGKPVGLGVAVSGQAVATCAHVINAALSRPLRTQERPDASSLVQVSFPLVESLSGLRIDTSVEVWLPPPTDGFQLADLAIIRPPRQPSLPPGVETARLASPSRYKGRVLEAFGYPTDQVRPMGAWSSCRLRNRVTGGLWQLDPDSEAAFRAQPGYSGTGLWDPDSGVTVGLLVAATPTSGLQDAYAVPAHLLLEYWPQAATDEALTTVTHDVISRVEIEVHMARAHATLTVGMPVERILETAASALRRIGVRRLDINAREQTLTAVTKMTWRSFGERIEVSVQTGRTEPAIVRIRSRPWWRTTLFDYGKTRQNMARIVLALDVAMEDALQSD